MVGFFLLFLNFGAISQTFEKIGPELGEKWNLKTRNLLTDPYPILNLFQLNYVLEATIMTFEHNSSQRQIQFNGANPRWTRGCHYLDLSLNLVSSRSLRHRGTICLKRLLPGPNHLSRVLNLQYQKNSHLLMWESSLRQRGQAHLLHVHVMRMKKRTKTKMIMIMSGRPLLGQPLELWKVY